MAYDGEEQIDADRAELTERCNGDRQSIFDTRQGPLDLKLPKLRLGSDGPGFLDLSELAQEIWTG